ncbi:MAG: phosphoribosylaminoimidazolesuccinocarboxamide synthase [Anaerolineae bacterium]|nr:phosphoribosylaminoimidazolesuccinocarboxamide synthase [Anaerolineae bacterium]
MLTHQDLVNAIPHVIQTVDLPGFGPKQSGKVRDSYAHNGKRILITTDRVSAFDRVLGSIPFKGQVLNQLSAWWFEQTRDIVDNHVIEVPDPNVTIAKNAEPLPVEVVVRGYITGVTKTSLWTLYAQGDRWPYGIFLPDGLQKNDELPQPIITPTTKAEYGGHDERLTRDEIIGQKLVPPPLWEKVEEVALALFDRGQQIACQAGLILVDTKYEFGLVEGRLTLIDEFHTPDSSRFWTLDSYQPGQEPEQFDKEVLRQWFVNQGYCGEGEIPMMPDDFIARVAELYISAFERLTGQEFIPGKQPAVKRIARNLAPYKINPKSQGGKDAKKMKKGKKKSRRKMK